MRSDTLYLKFILLLSLIGILVAGKLLSVHVRFTSGQATLTESCSVLSASDASQGCATVAVSDYSDVAGIPIAAFAMAFYTTLLLLTFWAMRNFQSAYEPLYVGFFLSTLSILVTVVMFYISRFVLKSFCPYCAVLWAVNLAIWSCFVKHLNLGWGAPWLANLELVRPKNLNLRRERVLGSFGVGLACFLAFSVIGLAAKGLQGSESQYGDRGSVLSDFQNAPQVFLPAEAFGGPQSKGNVEANPAPVLEIVEFADFQCPACRMAAQFLRPFVLKHKNKVRVSFRHFPLDASCNPSVPNGMHAFACLAAKSSICAGKQGKFWQFHDQLFDRQEELSASVIAEIGTKLNLDESALAACLADPATQTQLLQEMQWGDAIQLQSTPTIVINRRKLEGGKTPAELEAILESVEAEKSGK